MRPESGPPARRTLRHRTDWMALLSGLLFIGAGAVFIGMPNVEPVIMLPVVLVGLGVAGMIAILARAIRR